MKRGVWFLLLLAAASASAQNLTARIDRIVKNHGIPKAELGLAVMQLGSTPQHLLYDLNGEQEFIPASVSKIATAATVLERLGPSFKFQTTLWTSGKIKGDELDGNLILKGGGDPSFVSETMWNLVNEFRRNGIKKIFGDVIVDDFDFDSVRNDSSRETENVDRAYAAPVGAMSFNWNAINIYVRPTEVGQPPKVIFDPTNDGLTLINKARTVNSSGQHLWADRRGDKVVVDGTIGVNHSEVVFYKDIVDPAEWSGRNLIYFLNQRGITVTGKVQRGHKPADAKLMAKVESKPVRDCIADMLKYSNNFVAEMLTKDLAAQAGKTPATLAEGMTFIRVNMIHMGLKSKNFNLINPSGLNHRNHLRPVDLIEILRRSRKNFSYFPEMLSGFPLAGIDGTLKRRMELTPAQGRVRAKTGSLDGVVALSGFAARRDGSLYAFAFMYNGKKAQDGEARSLFDQLAVELVK